MEWARFCGFDRKANDLVLILRALGLFCRSSRSCKHTGAVLEPSACLSCIHKDFLMSVKKNPLTIHLYEFNAEWTAPKITLWHSFKKKKKKVGGYICKSANRRWSYRGFIHEEDEVQTVLVNAALIFSVNMHQRFLPFNQSLPCDVIIVRLLTPADEPV